MPETGTIGDKRGLPENRDASGEKRAKTDGVDITGARDNQVSVTATQIAAQAAAGTPVKQESSVISSGTGQTGNDLKSDGGDESTEQTSETDHTNVTLTVPQATSLPPEPLRPEHGSDEWHRLRRLNHKEVERRRRESINIGINELQELLPTSNSNKAQVLKRAAEYIRRLKENESANIEKWTLEKLITDQAVNELANSNEKLKTELEKAYRELEYWKKTVLDFESKKGKDTKP